LNEKGAGVWSGVSGYFGDGWDATTYQLGFNQKWNLADVAGNGFIKGDMGLDAALALVSMGDIAALRAAAKAQKLVAVENRIASSGGGQLLGQWREREARLVSWIVEPARLSASWSQVILKAQAPRALAIER